MIKVPFTAFSTDSGLQAPRLSSSDYYSSVNENSTNKSFFDNLQQAANRVKNEFENTNTNSSYNEYRMNRTHDQDYQNNYNVRNRAQQNTDNELDEGQSVTDETNADPLENTKFSDHTSAVKKQENIKARSSEDISEKSTVSAESDNSASSDDLSNDLSGKLQLLLQMLGIQAQPDNSSSAVDDAVLSKAESSNVLTVLTNLIGQQSAQPLNQDVLKALQSLRDGLNELSNQNTVQSSDLSKLLDNIILQIQSNEGQIGSSDGMLQSTNGNTGLSALEFIERLDQAIKKALTGIEDVKTSQGDSAEKGLNVKSPISNLSNANMMQGEAPELQKIMHGKNETANDQLAEKNNSANVVGDTGKVEVKNHASNQMSMDLKNGESHSDDKGNSVNNGVINKTSETTNQSAIRQDFSLDLKQNTGLNNVTKLEQVQLPKTTQNIFTQIVQKAKLTNELGISEMSIQLKPDFLGKLHLNVSMENGLVTAKFNAENHQVKAIIEANLNTLRDALSEQGVKVDQLVVNVGTEKNYSGSQSRENQNLYHNNINRKNNNSLAANDTYEYGISGNGMASVIEDYYGSSVNFTA